MEVQCLDSKRTTDNDEDGDVEVLKFRRPSTAKSRPNTFTKAIAFAASTDNRRRRLNLEYAHGQFKKGGAPSATICMRLKCAFRFRVRRGAAGQRAGRVEGKRKEQGKFGLFQVATRKDGCFLFPTNQPPALFHSNGDDSAAPLGSGRLGSRFCCPPVDRRHTEANTEGGRSGHPVDSSSNVDRSLSATRTAYAMALADQGATYKGGSFNRRRSGHVTDKGRFIAIGCIRRFL
uniref:Uncharacterized protein n=1 Tax=Trichuris muris TaxID=70415 RepID=A0A5S6QRY5_TRIMR